MRTISTQNITLNDYSSLKIIQPLYDKSLLYWVEHYFDLLQTWCLARHYLLTAFLINLRPFLICNGLQFTNIYSFACCIEITATSFFKSHQISFIGLKSADCNGPSRIFQDIHCNQVHLKVYCIWKVQWCPGFNILTDGMWFSPRMSWMNQSWFPRTAGFQIQRTQSSPRADWVTIIFQYRQGRVSCWVLGRTVI